MNKTHPCPHGAYSPVYVLGMGVEVGNRYVTK